MDDQERVALSEAELAAFAQRVDRWAQSLSPRERAFLQQMLADAADAANEDVSGYANLTSLVQDEVAGFASGMFGPDSFIGTIVGYADGVARAEEDYASATFAPEDRTR